MSLYALNLQEISKSEFMTVGGKGANLGELFKVEGIEVPEGFCISTEAFKKIIEELSISELINELSFLKMEDKTEISKLSAKIRKVIEEGIIPKDIREEIISFISKFGEKNSYAIRSSATAEDLPSASFAGQQDTYLNIIGEEQILKHISKCWASLFTERAIIYRIQNGFDHSKVFLSVVVQRMLNPQVSGVLFTADIITSNRKIVSIDANFGLGEAVVSGLVNSDSYKVCHNKIIDKKIFTKKIAIYPLKNGGVKKEVIDVKKQNEQVLTDKQILELEGIGRRIEEYFGCPQDIEWCLVDEVFYIVQSRPITTLYPIPKADDGEKHVYVSVGHQQMMTDVIKPLGISMFQLTAFRRMFEGGGRLFVDVAKNLVSPAERKALIGILGKSEPLTGDALMKIIEKGDFLELLPDNKKEEDRSNKKISPLDLQGQIEDNKTIVSDLIKKSEESIEELKQSIQSKSGVDLFDFILDDIEELKNILFNKQSASVIRAAMNASERINEKMEEWLGEKNIVDVLSQSVSNNITSKMGLDLLDVADMIRPYPEVIDYLQKVKNEDFLSELPKFNRGKEIQETINDYLNKYGMRCGGEIDITKTRWSEKPTILIPMILRNIKNFEPNASKEKFEKGREEAFEKEQELLEKLERLPDGKKKAKETKYMISIVRSFIGYREYPKYAMINRYFIYKQALIKEAERLVKDNIIEKKEDIYYLTFEEFKNVVGTHELDYKIINERKAQCKLYERLTPPRVMKSDGEIVIGEYKEKDDPEGVMLGLPVSTGIIEGRARVILNMEDANLEKGDILVTPFTDPSWTPLFVSIKGLVTEVGGLMTHGAVIAREYGLPAVVGVENATKLIKDGQRIRIDGTKGYVEILS